MPRALGARVLRRGAGPGVLPPLLISCFPSCAGARRGLRLAGRGCGGRGMLSGSGAVRPGVRAPWAPPAWVGSGVVGGLVVNCIVDASICGRPRYGELCCWSPVCLFFCLVRRAARAGVVRVARAPCVVLCCVLFVFMSVRWMPWHRGPMKDAVACDIPRGAGLRAVIRGFPNGGTRRPLWGVTRV